MPSSEHNNSSVRLEGDTRSTVRSDRLQRQHQLDYRLQKRYRVSQVSAHLIDIQLFNYSITLLLHKFKFWTVGLYDVFYLIDNM